MGYLHKKKRIKGVLGRKRIWITTKQFFPFSRCVKSSVTIKRLDGTILRFCRPKRKKRLKLQAIKQLKMTKQKVLF
ncbi:MAG: hypothetical protein DRP74_06775 [Candidatus Omnitrophota bacterium]|nr:MAG: hypothetical protein DRP74_06775 [Candidatus Omnitrophota bacterium]